MAFLVFSHSPPNARAPLRSFRPGVVAAAGCLNHTMAAAKPAKTNSKVGYRYFFTGEAFRLTVACFPYGKRHRLDLATQQVKRAAACPPWANRRLFSEAGGFSYAPGAQTGWRWSRCTAWRCTGRALRRCPGASSLRAHQHDSFWVLPR